MNAPLLPRFRHRARTGARPPLRLLRAPMRKPLGARLVEAGHLQPGDLVKALALQARQDAPLGQILQAQGMVDEPEVLSEVAAQAGITHHDTDILHITPELTKDLSPIDCLVHEFLPLHPIAGGTLVALTNPDRIDAIRRKLPERYGELHFTLVSQSALQKAVARGFSRQLTQQAEARPADAYSCRTKMGLRGLMTIFCLTTLLTAFAASAPGLTAGALLGLGFLLMIATTLLKLAALLAALRRPDASPKPTPDKLPKFTLLVPLYGEGEIAGTLIMRLKNLSYPSELMEIVLIAEADDELTRTALARTRLPEHMRSLTVPDGTLKTKPRALNYALDFTDGQYIGIYDAEDAPASDQLHRVAEAFASADDKLACVQGVLSFYNWSHNWLSRCFFFEYAGWFRVMLPGLARLGFAIPLGGTTLFFRRSAIIHLGGWDAHNVTEDADLGIRLARFGYHSKVISTVTEEEANSDFWPWVKQRSRWLKGYAITWAVHMRRPRRLLRELGLRKFIGFQILFLGTLTSFFLAPAFWATSLSLMSGVAAPATFGLTATHIMLATALFVFAELLNFTMFWIATRDIRQKPLFIWVFSLPLYFTFASIAAYKAFAELWRKPFFWDKTQHGQFGGLDEVKPDQDVSNFVELTGIDEQPRFKSNRKVVA